MHFSKRIISYCSDSPAEGMDSTFCRINSALGILLSAPPPKKKYYRVPNIYQVVFFKGLYKDFSGLIVYRFQDLSSAIPGH